MQSFFGLAIYREGDAGWQPGRGSCVQGRPGGNLPLSFGLLWITTAVPTPTATAADATATAVLMPRIPPAAPATVPATPAAARAAPASTLEIPENPAAGAVAPLSEKMVNCVVVEPIGAARNPAGQAPWFGTTTARLSAVRAKTPSLEAASTENVIGPALS